MPFGSCWERVRIRRRSDKIEIIMGRDRGLRSLTVCYLRSGGEKVTLRPTQLVLATGMTRNGHSAELLSGDSTMRDSPADTQEDPAIGRGVEDVS